MGDSAPEVNERTRMKFTSYTCTLSKRMRLVGYVARM